MADFTMPALGADMETGKLVEWLVAPGARVKSGDVVAVVETHKGAIDVECFLDGVIDDLAPLGEALAVGAVLARVRGAGEVGSATAATAAATATAATAAAAATARPATASAAAASESPPAAIAADATPQGLPPRPDVPAVPDRPLPPVLPADPARPAAALAMGASRAKVSPAARRRAGELGVDADTLPGRGSDGAVTLADVQAAAAVPSAASASSPRADAPKRGFDAAQMRLAIAASMARSKREIPHYYLGDTIDFAAADAWLADYNRERDPAERLLPATLLLKATAVALAAVPQLNGFHEGGVFRAGSGIHVGWAIALRGGGLVAPAIHDADRLSLPALMTALRDLVQRARTGGLRSSELTDPTVTITNLGERGAESVHGVIYPPQVAIVGFGRIATRPWVVDGAVIARPLVNVSLAADHRASDGHVGGQLLAAIAQALQSPHTL